MADTLPGRLLAHATERPDGIAYWVKRRGIWQRISWRQAARRTACAAEMLERAGVVQGDRVLLIADPEPELHCAALAAMAMGASVVALDPAAKADRIVSAVSASAARWALVRDEEQAVKLAGVAPEQAPTVLAWRLERPMQVGGRAVGVLTFGSPDDEREPSSMAVPAGIAAPAFVTGGSTGDDARQAGHAELLQTAEELCAQLDLQPGARYFSAMPLAFGEAQAMFALALALPTTTCFAESPDQLEANMVELQPELSLMDHAFWTDAIARVRHRARAGVSRVFAQQAATGWLRERALRRPLRHHLGLGRAGAVLVAGGRPDESARATFAALRVPWLSVDARGRPMPLEGHQVTGAAA